MKHLTVILLSAALLACMASAARAAEKTESAPNASFGIAGSFGEYNAWERKNGESHMRYEFAPAYGGGLVFEKMFNNLLGIHSGLWFNRFSIDMTMKQSWKWYSFDLMSLMPIKMMSTGWSISVPLSLIVSLNASIFSFNILAGIKYTQIVDTDTRIDNIFMSYKKHFDMLPYMNQPQFAFTLGVTFKFRVARFVDIFVGGIGELYATEFIQSDDSITHLFSLTAIAGVMFRTNVFPIPAAAPPQ